MVRRTIGSTITKPKKLKSHVKFLQNSYCATISTITKPKKLQISRKITFHFILGGKKWVLPSQSQKNNKSHVKFLLILYWAAKNGFYHHEAKKQQQISRKISCYFLLGGEKWVLPSRSQKKYKSRVKFAFILYWVANNGFYYHEAKKYKSHVKYIFHIYWAAKYRFQNHEAKTKNTNLT